jgi:hypothetical protein
VPHLSARGFSGPGRANPTRTSRSSKARISPSPGLLMQAQGFPQVSPRTSRHLALSTQSPGYCSIRAGRAPGPSTEAARLRAAVVPTSSFAGVAQLVEHLFCKQVVRGSSPLASSERRRVLTARKEGCPSGQREQAVNLPAYAYVGSNPTPSTAIHREHGSRPAGVNPAGPHPQNSSVNAGVAQLVERQPSKLNVVGSSPISRSAPRPLSNPSEALPT